MFYTDFQREAMRYVGLAKVHYKNMWKSKKALGYVTPGSPHDNIYIAKDFPDQKVRKIALLHECGHIKYNHTSVDMKQEIKDIKKLFEDLGKPFSRIRAYGDAASFINICMDLEVNSKLLTLGNTKYMKDHDFALCTPESFEVEIMDNFRDYYVPLIKKLPDEDKEFEEFQKKIQEMLDEIIKDINPNQNSQGNAGGQGSPNGKSNGGKSKKGDQGEQEDNQEGSGNGSSEQDDSDENDDEEEGNVNEALREDENSDTAEGFDGGDSGSGIQPGKGHVGTSNLDVKDNCSFVISGFLRKIVGSAMIYLPDSMKHYNRGSRENSDGFMYSSIRKRNRTDKKRMAIILDSSGSMDSTSVLTALGSIKNSLSVLSNESSVIVWDTHLCEEFPITKVPDRVSSGGGTDMAAALRYAIEVKKADTICMYSDFETSLEPMVDILKKHKVEMYSIVVTGDTKVNKKTFKPGYWNNEETAWKNYIKLNKDWILVG